MIDLDTQSAIAGLIMETRVVGLASPVGRKSD